MTEEQLLRTLATLDPGPWPHDPSERLRRAELLADDRPGDGRLARGIRALHARASADDGLPLIVSGVRRESLVRWDELSTTWEGRGPNGGPAMVRVLRPYAARDPVLRRLLLREAFALGAVESTLDFDDGPLPALTLDLDGPSIPDEDEQPVHAGTAPLARWLATGVASLGRWEAAGLGIPELTLAELRQGEHGLSVACLTSIPRAEDHSADNLARIARALSSWDEAEDPISERLGMLVAAPPDRPSQAGALITAAFAEELSERRHRLVQRWRTQQREHRHRRLLAAIRDLERAVPPPPGRGAVGVDLDGQVTVLDSDAGRVTWRTSEGALRVWSLDEGFDPQITRRLLRARAAAPPNPRLQQQVGGRAETVEAVTRWAAAGLQLRVLRLLLERA